MRSLRTQLILSHLTLAGIMALTLGATLFSLGRVSRSVDGILRDNFQTILAMDQLDRAFQVQMDAASRGRTEDVARARRAFTEGLERAIPTLNEASERSQLKVLQQNYEEVRLRRGSAEAEAAANRVRTLIRSLRENNARAVMQDFTAAQAAAESTARRAQYIAAGSVGLAILLGLMMVQRALTPLDALSQRAERIAEGVFEPGADLERKDEVGTLAHRFTAMEESLGEMRRREARRLQRAEQMSDAALDSLYDPVIVTDASRRIVYLNRAAAGLFGGLPAGQKQPAADHISDRRILRAIQNALEEKVIASEDEREMITIPVAGADRIYRLRATPMKEDAGQLLGSVTVLEDITHLRVLDRLKTEFVGVASHELRTPVTSLMLGNQLLLEGALGELTEDQREVLRAQEQDLARLEKLMRDLLDVTRLEAGSAPLRLEWVTPAELIAGPMHTLHPQAARKGVSLQVDSRTAEIRVRADRTQIGRVLTNLVANAIRHTPTGGSVRVVVTPANKEVSFRVEDTGEGIPAEYLERIFERFVQVPGATQGGAGLGLSIAQNIVRAHGGEMNVASKVGQGSTFTFTLPMDSDEPQEGSSI